MYTRNRSTRDGLLTEEVRILNSKQIKLSKLVQATMVALGEVMGGDVGPELVGKIWSSIGVTIAPHIENKFNYKQFSGIAAYTERIFCWDFCRGDNAGPATPKVCSLRKDFQKF